MKNIIAIYRRELGSYFVSPIAYAVIGVFLGIVGLVFYFGMFSRIITDVMRYRMQAMQSGQAGDMEKRMTELIQTLRPEPKISDRIAVKLDGRVLLVKVDDIDWVEAADNYVNLHVGADSHLIRETMSALEDRLPAPAFMRISRSAMVNVERIRELQPMFHGEYVVILRNGTRLTLSRTYRDKLQHLLGKEKE